MDPMVVALEDRQAESYYNLAGVVQAVVVRQDRLVPMVWVVEVAH